jgi:hypothetical protein
LKRRAKPAPTRTRPPRIIVAAAVLIVVAASNGIWYMLRPSPQPLRTPPTGDAVPSAQQARLTQLLPAGCYAPGALPARAANGPRCGCFGVQGDWGWK